MRKLRAAFEALLEGIVITLMVVLALEVLVGVAYRKAGHALVWYDEIASVLLAWLTYYGAALAALKRAHIGFPGLLASLPPRLRLPLAMLSEALVIAFFVLLAWVGWSIMGVLATSDLVSLPSVSVEYTQSVIPIGAMLFVIAELLVLPEVWHEARTGQRPGAAAELTH